MPCFKLGLDTGVVERSDSHQFCLYCVADVECLNELVDALLCHVLVCTCECLESLVRMRISLATENGLDGFSHDSPCIVEVFLQLLLVEDELAQTLQCALDGDDAVSERHAYVAENGRVGKVAADGLPGASGRGTAARR